MPAVLDPLAAHSAEHGLRVNDPGRMLEFYCDVVGFDRFGEIFIPGGHVWGLRFGTSMLKLLYRPDHEATTGSSRQSCHYMTVHVLNAADMAEACKSSGTPILVPYSAFTSSRAGDPGCGYCVVEDPEGNSVEFSQGSPWVTPTDSFRTTRIL